MNMIEGEDVLMRPVLRGMLRAESLVDGSVDLAFVMLCNEALDVEQENNRRHAAAPPPESPRRRRN
jgi:hypothetical protein